MQQARDTFLLGIAQRPKDCRTYRSTPPRIRIHVSNLTNLLHPMPLSSRLMDPSASSTTAESVARHISRLEKIIFTVYLQVNYSKKVLNTYWVVRVPAYITGSFDPILKKRIPGSAKTPNSFASCLSSILTKFIPAPSASSSICSISLKTRLHCLQSLLSKDKDVCSILCRSD